MLRTTSVTRIIPVAIAALLLCVAIPRPARAADEPAVPDKATLEKQFADMLTNATLIGGYSTAGKEAPAKEDKYTIVKAVKGEGDNWVITAKFGLVPVDITIPVRWAGDTPMMQMTNQKIPGMGTFSVRIMFYKDQYAGTWDAGDHGGLMWGRIEHGNPTTKPAAKPADPKAADPKATDPKAKPPGEKKE